jgi:hypothetical protein
MEKALERTDKDQVRLAKTAKKHSRVKAMKHVWE